MHPSWIKAFLITPIVTWIVGYTGYRIFGFTPNAYLLSNIPAGLISAILFYYLLPKSKFMISVLIYTALYILNLYLPDASGELQSVSRPSYVVFVIAAGAGILISIIFKRKSQSISS